MSFIVDGVASFFRLLTEYNTPEWLLGDSGTERIRYGDYIIWDIRVNLLTDSPYIRLSIPNGRDQLAEFLFWRRKYLIDLDFIIWMLASWQLIVRLSGLSAHPPTHTVCPC